jgi:GAF domain-containing protein
VPTVESVPVAARIRPTSAIRTDATMFCAVMARVRRASSTRKGMRARSFGYGGICYYRGPAVVRAFMALPVEEDGHLRGALCVDRLDDRPFTPAEEAIVHSTVGQLLRAMEN